MKHAREDYNRIQDPAGLIPENEPVFLLRAQDKHAPEVVAFWASLVHREGGDGEIANMAMRQSRAMKDWQHAHGKKSPDLPDETVPQPVKQAPIKSFKELEYKVGWERYEKVRKLNVHQFSELFQRGLKGERFDEMVDGLEAKP